MEEEHSFRVVTDREEFELRTQTIEALLLCRTIRPAIFAADPGISEATFEKGAGIEPPAITRRRIALKAAWPNMLGIMRCLDDIPREVWLRRSELTVIRDALRQFHNAIVPFLDPSPNADVVSGAFTTLLDTLDDAEKAVWDAIGREDWIFQPKLTWLSQKSDTPAETNIDTTVLPDGAPTQPVVLTPLQVEILKALDGRALTKDKLAAEVCGGDDRRFYREGGITALMDIGRVKNNRRIGGNYRPDAPPPQLMG